MSKEGYPKLILPDGFDDVWDPVKEYIGVAKVELENGNCYQVFFITPNRLNIEINIMTTYGKPYCAEPGMIVLARVTVEDALQAVKLLAEEGFFEDLKPLNE